MSWEKELKDKLIRDLCSVEFRSKSETRRLIYELIKELRKKDEEELIKKIEIDSGLYGGIGDLYEIKQIIKDYYKE
ncbi:MAG TPA: hypothetical protein PKN54_00320 [Candidatus Cloacimonas acidaminovorans]|nr:hypothetical protein [Candidatus Cloacimonas acidaminovorans]